jgi:pyridoxal phosphate enzyme (YggS family)
LQAKLAQVRERISAAARAASRDPGEVVLLAVSKTFPAAAVIEAAAAGQTRFGENYVQEALDKIAAVHAQASRLHLEWHFIGPIQSNKTRAIAEHFDWVQSVDRLKIAQRLSEQRPPALPPLNVLVQVNISAETSKSGVAPEQAAELVRAVAALPRLRLRGLMAIPAPTPGADAQRRACAQLRALFEQLRTQLRRDLQPDAAAAFDTLSMGMSDDLEAAIAEGSTMVRIGTAIFGTRVKGGAA